MPSSDYKCTEASFGVVVTKKTAPESSYTAATDNCSADGAMVHLPTPKNDAENQWYMDYVVANHKESHVAWTSFWLGINDAQVEGRGDRIGQTILVITYNLLLTTN